MIYLGADHRGYKLKEAIHQYLATKGLKIRDLGTNSEQAVDFPVYAKAVAEKVAADQPAKGILLCGNGQGVCIAANKIKGIRAGTAWNAELAASIRQHDDANIMCLPADFVAERELPTIIDAFLTTEFEAIDRRRRRKQQITELEQ